MSFAILSLLWPPWTDSMSPSCDIRRFFGLRRIFFIPIVSDSPGLSIENRGRGSCRLVESVPRMAFVSIAFFLSFFFFFWCIFIFTFFLHISVVEPVHYVVLTYTVSPRIWNERSEPSGLSVWETCRRLRNWNVWRRPFRKFQHIYHGRWLWRLRL